MARTNVCVARGGVLGCLLLIAACEATVNQPAVHIAPVEVADQVAAISVTAEVQAPTAEKTNPPLSSDEPLVDATEAASVETEPAQPPSPAVVHAAELRGRVELHAGARLMIEPLVITSNTYPVPGCLAHLWIETPEEDGVMDWKHFAEARVTTPLLFGTPMELEIVEDLRVRPALHKGDRVRVQWEW